MWWENGPHAWGWVGMGFAMTLFWIVLVASVVAVVRWSLAPGGGPASPPSVPGTDTTTTARRVLDQRLARGEIDVAEYETRLAALERRS